MAYARDTFTGNGTNKLFNVNFPYLSTSHVEVRVAGVLQSPLTFINATTVELATAPANGAVVEVKRNTPKETRLVDWEDGSALREADLDLADIQVLYITQEAFDEASLAIRVNSQDRWDAQSKRIINVATPVDGNDAVNKTYADSQLALTAGNVSAAQAAQTAAQTAQGLAEDARDDAQTAAGVAAGHAAAADASADAAALSAAQLPNAATAGADRFIRVNAGADGWVYLTAAQVLSAIGAQAALGFTPEDAANNHGYLDVVQAWTRSQRYSPATITYSATPAWDLDTQPYGRLTLAGSPTIAAPTNQRDGATYLLEILTGAGGFTVAWNAAYDFGEEGTPTVPTGASKTALFMFVSNGTSMRCVGRWNN